MIVIVFGLPGSGKSFFASRLANLLNADYVNSDRLRKELLEKRNYSDGEKLLVYEEMLKQMRKGLEQSKDIVLDATFYLNKIKEDFIKEAKGNESIFFIEVIADEALVQRRLSQPRTESEADYAVYKKIKQQYEPFYLHHLILDSTDNNIEEMLNKSTKYLQLKDDKRTSF